MAEMAERSLPVRAMHRLRIEPSELELEAYEGETIMETAHRCGYFWPTVCHGDAECGVCWIEVLEGAAAMAPVGESERRGLEACSGRVFHGGELRLACRAVVTGSAVVWKRGVRPARPEEDLS